MRWKTWSLQWSWLASRIAVTQLYTRSGEREPAHPVSGRDRSGDGLRGIRVVIGVDHDDDAVAAGRSEPQEGIEAAVPAAVPQAGRAALGAHDEQAQAFAADLPAHHLLGHRLRD